MKLLVASPKYYDDYDNTKELLDHMLVMSHDRLQIVTYLESGMRSTIDRFSKENDVTIIEVLYDELILDVPSYVDSMLLFWDQEDDTIRWLWELNKEYELDGCCVFIKKQIAEV